MNARVSLCTLAAALFPFAAIAEPIEPPPTCDVILGEGLPPPPGYYLAEYPIGQILSNDPCVRPHGDNGVVTARPVGQPPDPVLLNCRRIGLLLNCEAFPRNPDWLRNRDLSYTWNVAGNVSMPPAALLDPTDSELGLQCLGGGKVDVFVSVMAPDRAVSQVQHAMVECP